MPPAISDDEASDVSVEQPPKRERPSVAYKVEEEEEEDESDDDLAKKGTNGVAAEDEEDEDEDEEGLDDDEYVVEKILSHMIAEDGQPRFEVKWEGFEKKSDRTWEPEENFEGTAQAILDDYFTSIGGREKLFEETTKALNTKKRGRQSTGNGAGGNTKRARQNGHPADSDAPQSKKAVEFKPPAGGWDDLVETVDMFRNEDGALTVLLNWKNGHKTQHPTKQAYARCPQKILQFYESKINFKTD